MLYVGVGFNIAQNISLLWGEGQHLERPNVERSIFWNCEILNMKKTKDELFDFFIFEFILLHRTGSFVIVR